MAEKRNISVKLTQPLYSLLRKALLLLKYTIKPQKCLLKVKKTPQGDRSICIWTKKSIGFGPLVDKCSLFS